METPNRPIRIFVCYAREDEPLLRDLEKQLGLLRRQGFIEVWHDREISQGTNWEQEIAKNLNRADIILLLVSPDFINSDYCYGVEMQRAMESHQAGEVLIIPIILRPVFWRSTPFGKIQALPTDGMPLTRSDSQSQEKAFYDVAEGIRKVVEMMLGVTNTPSIHVDENTSTKFPPILPQLEIPDFTGRSEELEKLRQLLLTPDSSHTMRIAGLVGAGGMGKSTLVYHFARAYQEHFPDGVIGITVGHGTAYTLVEELARNVGLDIDKQQPPWAFMQKHFSKRRSLLVFDNVEEASVKQLLPGGEKCVVIVTTRNRNLCIKSLQIASSSLIDLEGFTLAETEGFFIRLLGKQRITSEPESVQRIHRLVGGHPLALRIIGDTLRDDEKFNTLGKYVTKLEQRKQHLSSFLQNPDDSDLDIHASFSLSLDYLKEEQKLLFASLGACAPEGFTLRTAQAVSNLDEEVVSSGMTRLLQLSLVKRIMTGDRYMLHPLLFDFAHKQATRQGLLKSAEQRHTEHFVAYAEEHKALYSATFVTLEEEFAALFLTGMRLIHDIHSLHDVQDAMNFYMILKPILLGNRGYALQANDWLQMLLQAAKEQNSTFYEIFCLLQRESIALYFAWYEEAEQLLEEAERLIERVEDATQRTVLTAMLQAKHGDIYRIRNNAIEAEKKLKEALSLWDKLGRQWERGKVFSKLGALYAVVYKKQKAEDALIRSLEIYEQLEDMKGQGKVLNTLGALYQRLGKMQEAEQTLQAALEIAEQLGDRKSIGMIQIRLGYIYQTQGKKKEAKDALQKALSISIEVGEEQGNTTDMARILRELGHFYQKQRSYDQANICFQKCFEIQEVEHSPFIAKTTTILVHNLLTLHQKDLARQYLERAQVIVPDDPALLKAQHRVFQENDEETLRERLETYELQSDTQEKALTLHKLGVIYQSNKKLDPAKEVFLKSLEIGRKLKLTRHTCIVLKSLGEVYALQGNIPDAEEALEESYTLATGKRTNLLWPMLREHEGSYFWSITSLSGSARIYKRVLLCMKNSRIHKASGYSISWGKRW